MQPVQRIDSQHGIIRCDRVFIVQEYICAWSGSGRPRGIGNTKE